MSDLAKSNIAAIALLLYGYSSITTAEFILYEKDAFKLSASLNSAVHKRLVLTKRSNYLR